MKLTLFLLINLSFCSAIFAQQQLPVLENNIQIAYNKNTRSLTGKPGSKYWQNRADYDLRVNFEPATRLVKGTANVVYYNNSPDTLREMWFKLYPNLYLKGHAAKNVKREDENEGVKITAISINGKQKPLSDLITDSTNMHTSILPLGPGRCMAIEINYFYILNKGSHIRTGQVDSGSYFIAYFFPRIAVYDDIDGWNKYPYRGSEEFYNDFCNFKAAVTVPKNYTVWATGDLLNAKKVFKETIEDRIKKAEKNDAIIYVIDSNDIKNHNVTAENNYNTFQFAAKNVTDFVFATSDHYIWRATSVLVDKKTRRRTRVDAVFNPVHKDYFEVIDFARKTVGQMSYSFPAWPFPYAHETVFDGLDQMEYPMMVNDNPVEKREDGITLTDHEIFHTMFPFYMGINETKYGWMDEGWATIGEWLISTMIEPAYTDDYGITATAKTSGEPNDSPIMTLTTDNKGSGLFTNSYPKPAFGYLYVKDYLGEKLFTKALHNYISNWQGKHPMPYDFFYSMNEGSGKNLNWFWQRWFFETGVTDMAIKGADKTATGYNIRIENKGRKPMPVYLTLSYTDGTVQKLHNTIGVWEKGETVILIPVVTVKTLSKIMLGSMYVPDKKPEDNVFEVK